jgi:hypothetical protein
MNELPRRCECIWCCQVFYSDEYYKFGTCSSCLLSKVVTPVSRLADILRQAEQEALEDLRAANKNIKKLPE